MAQCTTLVWQTLLVSRVYQRPSAAAATEALKCWDTRACTSGLSDLARMVVAALSPTMPQNAMLSLLLCCLGYSRVGWKAGCCEKCLMPEEDSSLWNKEFVVLLLLLVLAPPPPPSCCSSSDSSVGPAAAPEDCPLPSCSNAAGRRLVSCLTAMWSGESDRWWCGKEAQGWEQNCCG